MKDIFRKICVPILSVLAIIGLDQWTKFLVITNLSNIAEKTLRATFKASPDEIWAIKEVPVIKEALVLSFVKNQGMAWGMLQNKQIVFIIITPIVVAALIAIYYRMPFTKKYILLRICDIFLVGGALGNLIDRVARGGNLFHGYVVDMIYAKIINFPVFNIADSFITVGFAILVISMFFVYKEEDFDLIFGTGKNKKESRKNEEIKEVENDENN